MVPHPQVEGDEIELTDNEGSAATQKLKDIGISEELETVLEHEDSDFGEEVPLEAVGHLRTNYG